MTILNFNAETEKSKREREREGDEYFKYQYLRYQDNIDLCDRLEQIE